MIGLNWIVEFFSTRRVTKAVDEVKDKNLGKGAERIRKDAAGSIKTSPEPSRKGTPPHTRKGKLRRAIKASVENEIATIGPSSNEIGDIGGKLEHGDDVGQRPFMGPALNRNMATFAEDWEGTIGE